MLVVYVLYGRSYCELSLANHLATKSDTPLEAVSHMPSSGASMYQHKHPRKATTKPRPMNDKDITVSFMCHTPMFDDNTYAPRSERSEGLVINIYVR